MKAKCQNCGKEYEIKDQLLQKTDLRMRCRDCGEIIVMKKQAPAETFQGLPISSMPPSAPGTSQPAAGDKILPMLKQRTGGMEEFDLGDRKDAISMPPRPSAQPPTPGRGQTVSGLSAVPPVRPSVSKDVSKPRVKIGDLEFDLGPPAPPPPAATRLDDLPVAKQKDQSLEFDLSTQAVRLTVGKDPVSGRFSISDVSKTIDLPSRKRDGDSSGLSVLDRTVKDLDPSALKQASVEDLPALKQYDESLGDGITADLEDLPAVLAASMLPDSKRRQGASAREAPDPFGGLDLPPKRGTLPMSSFAPAEGKEAPSRENIFGAPAEPPPAPDATARDGEGPGAAPLAPGQRRIGFTQFDLDQERAKKKQAGGGLDALKPISTMGSFSAPPLDDLGDTRLDGQSLAADLSAVSPAFGEAEQELKRADRGVGSAAGAVESAKRAIAPGWVVVSKTKGIVTLILVLLVIGGLAAAWKTGAHNHLYRAFSKYILGEDIEAFYRLRDDTIARTRASLAKDEYKVYREGCLRLAQLHDGNKKDRTLAAYTAYMMFLIQLRFGKDPTFENQGDTILSQIPVEKQPDRTYMLATSAQRLLRKAMGSMIVDSLTADATRNPKDTDVMNLGALGAYHMGFGDKSLALYKKLDAAEGHSPRGQFGVIRASFLAGDDKAGDSLLSDFITKNQGFVEGKILKAKRLVITGSVAQAEDLIQKVAAGPGIEPFMQIPMKTVSGLVFLRKEEYEKAGQVFDAILAKEPMNVDALVGMGVVDLNAANAVKAEARFGLVLGSDPENADAAFGLAEARVQLHQFKEAKELLARLGGKHKGNYKVHHISGKLAVALRDYKLAEEEYKKAIGMNPASLDSYVELSSIYYEQGRIQEAMGILDEAKKTLPLTAKLLTAFSKGHIGRGEFEKARGALSEALAKDPGYVPALYLMGVTLYGMKSYQEAALSFDKVAQKNPAYPGVVLYQGLILEAAGTPDKALAMYREALQKSPDDEKLLVRIAALDVAAKKYDDAKTIVEKVLAKNPESAEGLFYLGRVFMGQEKYTEALYNFEQAYKKSPLVGYYYLWAGLANEKMGEFSQAHAYAQKALEKDNSLAEAYVLRGRIRAKMGVIKDGMKDLRKALALRPELHEAWAPIGIIYEQLRDFPEAQKAYTQYLAHNPDDIEINARLGLVLYDLGSTGEAVARFTAAMKVAKESAPQSKWLFLSLFYLGMIEEKGGNDAKAVLIYKEYLKTAPEGNIDYEEVKKRFAALGGTMEEEE